MSSKRSLRKWRARWTEESVMLTRIGITTTPPRLRICVAGNWCVRCDGNIRGKSRAHMCGVMIFEHGHTFDEYLKGASRT